MKIERIRQIILPYKDVDIWISPNFCSLKTFPIHAFIDKYKFTPKKVIINFGGNHQILGIQLCLNISFSTPPWGSLWTILRGFSMAYTMPWCFCFSLSSPQGITYHLSTPEKFWRQQKKMWDELRIVYEMKCSKMNPWQDRAIYTIYWVSKLGIKRYLPSSPQNGLSQKCQQIFSCRVFSSCFEPHHRARGILTVILSKVMLCICMLLPKPFYLWVDDMR